MARVTVRRVLLLAVLVGVLFDLVVPGHAPGLNALVVTAVLLLAAALVADPAALRRFDLADAWLPVAALVLASMAAVRADPWLVTADVLLAGALLAGSVAAFAGTRITRGAVPRVLEAAGGVAAAACVGTLAMLQRAAADRSDAVPDGEREPRPASALECARGCPCSAACCSPRRSWCCSRSCSPPPMPCSQASRGTRSASTSRRISTTSRPAGP
jgi:hypothetical protein